MARIAFYAPLKAPDHPVPSGDRTVGRNLITAFDMAGHQVELASRLRSRTPRPDDQVIADLKAAAGQEIERLSALWADNPPDLWFTYHLYYKAPDLIGPALSRKFGMPYVVAEASHAEKRMRGPFSELAEMARNAITEAQAVLYVTTPDHLGLQKIVPAERLHHLPPFTPAPPGPPPADRSVGQPARMLAVGMMRPGDKTHSYQLLAQALRHTTSRNWQLDIVGDGVTRRQIEGFFAPFGDRVRFLGQIGVDRFPAIFRPYDFQVWPAVNEAYGMTLLDGLMQGLPVVAGAEGGVPDIVSHGETGLLSPRRDAAALGCNIDRMVRIPSLQNRLAKRAWRVTRNRHSVGATATTLGKLVTDLCRSS